MGEDEAGGPGDTAGLDAGGGAGAGDEGEGVGAAEDGVAPAGRPLSRTTGMGEVISPGAASWPLP